MVNNAICTATGNQLYPTIVNDGAGGTIITWFDLRSGTFDIYAQKEEVLEGIPSEFASAQN